MKNKDFFPDFLRLLSGPRLAFLTFIAAGGYFLWTEHQAHLLTVLPYLFFLLCPLMHIFMHGGHGGHGGHGDDRREGEPHNNHQNH